MLISKLYLKNYRNLKEGYFNFSRNMNYIYGRNAQGKTNLLEAIWMFTGARSFRKSKDLEIVNFKNIYAKLQGNFFFENRDQSISVMFAEKKRKIFLNGIPTKYPTEMIGKFRAVIFTPNHMSFVKDGPENRRRFLDSALCQLNSGYAKEIVEYSKILKHRNVLLKQIQKQGCIPDTLDIWNEKLVKTGSKVLKRRLDYLVELNRKFQILYSEISGGQEYTNLDYISSVAKGSKIHEISEQDMERTFRAKLKNSQFSDINQGFTSVGPHKDDLDITLENVSLKKFGSQGQQRSVVLSLKLAEAEVLKHSIGERPVVLLDDVMSELDDFRVSYVISKLEDYQTFITGCSKDTVKYFRDADIFHIENGGLL